MELFAPSTGSGKVRGGVCGGGSVGTWIASTGRSSTRSAFVREFLRAHPGDAHLRSQPVGHLTGSGFVLDAERARVLLLHHGRLHRWLQPGGHGEGEIDPREIALREIEEETGLADLTPLGFDLLDVDVHPIPARKSEPAHLHLDLRFAFAAPPAAEPRLSHESRELRWFPLDALPDDADDSMRRALRKLRRK